MTTVGVDSNESPSFLGVLEVRKNQNNDDLSHGDKMEEAATQTWATHES